MINNVTLVGRLTKDVDVRFTGSGTAVGNFNLAVERDFKNSNGERETDFINCVVWRKAAETLAQYTKKGSKIGVVGSIQTRNYENNEGQRVYVTEVNVERFNFMDSKSDNQGGQNNSQVYQQQGQPSDQWAPQSSEPIQISDDELPF